MNNLACNLVACGTLIRREVFRVMRIWVQSLIPPVITAALYFIIFGKLIGGQLGRLGNFSYLSYMVPGLIMMNIITSSYINASSSFFGLKFQRSIEEMLVSPMASWTILVGYVSASVVRAMAVGGLVLGIAMLFTPIHVIHPTEAILSALLSATVFSLTGLINGIYANKFDDVALVPTFVITPLSYLGGTFYSIHMLSEPWQTISTANPILYMVNTLRYGMLGVSDVPINIALLMMVALTTILTCVSLYLLKRGTRLRS